MAAPKTHRAKQTSEPYVAPDIAAAHAGKQVVFPMPQEQQGQAVADAADAHVGSPARRSAASKKA